MPETKDTLICNLYGGPGVGKSSYSAGLFYELKLLGYNAELVREYAKDRTWLEDYQTLANQSYVTAKQIHRQWTCSGKVDVIVTDSPILLGIAYQGHGCTPSFAPWLLEVYNQFRNVSFVLTRNTDAHPYNPKGRRQTEDEAIAKDAEIKALLEEMSVPFTEIVVDHKRTTQALLEAVTSILGPSGLLP